MTERDFPTLWCFDQDEALYEGGMPLSSNHGPAHRIVGCPDAVQCDRDPCHIAPDFGHRVLGMIVDVNASVLVGSLIALARAGFERLRVRLFHPTRVCCVQ